MYGKAFEFHKVCWKYKHVNLHVHVSTWGEYLKKLSTAGADASVEALKLYDMKLLTLAYLALLRTSSSRSLLNLS